VVDTWRQIRLHGPLNITAQQLHLTRVELGFHKPNIAGIVQRERGQKHAADIVRRTIGRHVAKIDNPVRRSSRRLESVFRSVVTNLLQVRFHGINDRVAVRVNVKVGSLLFEFQQREQLFLPSLDALGELGFRRVLFGSSSKGLNVGATEVFECTSGRVASVVAVICVSNNKEKRRTRCQLLGYDKIGVNKERKSNAPK